MHYTPGDIARNYHHTAQHKAQMPAFTLLCRAILGGALVALAAFGANSVLALLDNQHTAKLVSALLFPAGLAMILLCGGELFTSSNLMVLSVGKNRVSVLDVLRSWGLIFAGNFIGAAIIALLTVAAKSTDAAFLQTTLHTAEVKYALPWMDAFYRGILCNALVCAAVWMSYGTDSVPGKVIALYFPVMLFVLCGTEHSVTNMYYFTAAFAAGGFDGMTFAGFLAHHLLPVTLGNIVGGSVLFGGMVWLSFMQGERGSRQPEA